MTDEDMFEMQRAAAEMEKENEKLKDRIAKLTGESEAYKAMIDTYQRTSVNTVIELCPHCEKEVEMIWNVEVHGYKAFCPYCGERLMLCDECQHPNGEYCGGCDYSSLGDCCKYNQKGVDT